MIVHIWFLKLQFTLILQTHHCCPFCCPFRRTVKPKSVGPHPVMGFYLHLSWGTWRLWLLTALFEIRVPWYMHVLKIPVFLKYWKLQYTCNIDIWSLKYDQDKNDFWYLYFINTCVYINLSNFQVHNQSHHVLTKYHMYQQDVTM